MVSYSNSNYTNEFYDLTGIYFNSSKDKDLLSKDELDKRYLLKSGGNINGDISVSGNLFKPNNPAFKIVYGGASLTFTSVQRLPYDTIIYDTTNSFNTTNFEYVVPVAGKYFFSAGWLTLENSTFSVDIKKNGVIEIRSRINNQMAGFALRQSYVFSDCSVNDVIEVVVALGGIRLRYANDGEFNSYFEGFKID